ncbi:ER degradation-enhancing alpha-mannosidase-like protein 3 [Enoplosus armatus]
MFAAKARRLQEAGAIGVIFIDHREGSNSEETPLFQMVGDGDSTEDITLPLVFLFSREGAVLTDALEEHHNVDVLLLPKERQLGHDKKEKPVGMNIKLRLAEEGELEDGAARGPTLEFVLEKEEVLLKEEDEDELRGQRQSQQQLCTEAAGNDRTEPCSADLSQTPNSNSGPDTNP